MDTLRLHILRGDTVAAYPTAPCRLQYDEQHLIGIDAVRKKYGIDLWALAAEFAGKSPDWVCGNSAAIPQPPAADQPRPEAYRPEPAIRQPVEPERTTLNSGAVVSESFFQISSPPVRNSWMVH